MYRIFTEHPAPTPSTVYICATGIPRAIERFTRRCFRDYTETPARPALVRVFDYNGIIRRHDDTLAMVKTHDMAPSKITDGLPNGYLAWVLDSERARPDLSAMVYLDRHHPDAPTDNRRAALLWCYVHFPEAVATARACLRFMTETGCQTWQAHHELVWRTRGNAMHTRWVVDTPRAVIFSFSELNARERDYPMTNILRRTMFAKFPNLDFILCNVQARKGVIRWSGADERIVTRDEAAEAMDRAYIRITTDGKEKNPIDNG